jgi:hypothetical protein
MPHGASVSVYPGRVTIVPDVYACASPVMTVSLLGLVAPGADD